jgi:hypothetical protein
VSRIAFADFAVVLPDVNFGGRLPGFDFAEGLAPDFDDSLRDSDFLETFLALAIPLLLNKNYRL